LPINYRALREPELYVIFYEDRRALCLARAEEDGRSTTPGDARVCDDLREAFRAKAP